MQMCLWLKKEPYICYRQKCRRGRSIANVVECLEIIINPSSRLSGSGRCIKCHGQAPLATCRSDNTHTQHKSIVREFFTRISMYILKMRVTSQHDDDVCNHEHPQLLSRKFKNDLQIVNSYIIVILQLVTVDWTFYASCFKLTRCGN